MKVDSYNTAGVKWRRFLAWIIDWNIIGFSALLCISIFSELLDSIFKLDSTVDAAIMLILMLLFPICFVLRDLIFGGRSLGKRILGLTVLDRQTGTQAKAAQCALRNLFLFIVQIDAIIMLVSGTTLGDRTAQTVVVRKNALDHNATTHEITETNTYVPPNKTNTKRTILLVVLIVVAAIVLLISVIQIALSAARNTEEYKVAYNYFVESQAFEKLDVDKSKIWNNSYSQTVYAKPGSDAVTPTAEISFTVKGKSFQVICHEQNNVWVVCDECTGFS